MAQVGRIFLSVSEPQEVARAVRDPDHPHASPISGVIPPVDTRFGGPRANPGNPGGRPKGASLLAPVLRKLAEAPNEHGEGKEAEAIAQRALDAARDGDGKALSAILALMDRTDGPVVKERVQTNIQLEEGITLEERRRAT